MSRQDKSGLWNASYGEIGATLKALEDAGVSLEQFSKLRSDKKLAQEVADVITGKTREIEDNDFILSVDYSETLVEMITAGGYDWVNNNITARNFPIPIKMVGKKVDVSARIFHFNHSVSNGEVIAEMDKAGYRPADFFELLVLGKSQPDLQRQFPIVALSSIWRSALVNRYVTYLDVDGDDRRLNIFDFRAGWVNRFRFLGVRK